MSCGCTGTADKRCRGVAALATVVAAGVLITPFCGLLFGCGCSWPWSGLVEHCTYFDPRATIVCPWCENSGAGALSTLLATGAGALVAVAMPLDPRRPARAATGSRTAAGIAAFLLVGAVAGGVTAAATDYPNFLLSSPATRGFGMNPGTRYSDGWFGHRRTWRHNTVRNRSARALTACSRRPT